MKNFLVSLTWRYFVSPFRIVRLGLVDMLSGLYVFLSGRQFSRKFVRIILETAVEREKAVQTIYVHKEFSPLVVTLWVMRDWENFLGT